jgi:VIT1/CCC1 family predicted Fe2+/Mn2+ transporter
VVDDSSPLIGGVVTFFAFCIFGVMSLIPYIVGAGVKKDDQNHYAMISMIVGGVELFSLGFAKAIVIGLNKFVAGIESLLLGAFAIAVGYGLGLALEVKEQ